MPPTPPQSDLNLSSVEQAYWEKFLDVFMLVSPAKPEKGIVALIKRSRKRAERDNLELETVLEEELVAATERTHRRMALLASCSISNNNQNENEDANE